MTQSRTTKSIFIIITNRCNLRCSYCYEQGKNTLSADEATMRLVLEQELQDAAFDSFEVAFHGGEPFMEWPMVRSLSEWLWRHYSHRHLRLMATTNGTMLTDEMKQWLAANHERFALILSLDGGRETHNRNRCGSFDRIDFDFFLRNWPRQRVKMTISPEALPHAFADMMAIRELGFRINPSLALEVDWDMTAAPALLARELEKMVQYYLDHPDLSPCPMVDLNPALLADPDHTPRNRACGAGSNIIAYDMHGNPYPCHTFITDFNAPYRAAEVQSLFGDLRCKSGTEICPSCEGCLVFRHCEPCYGMGYSRRGGMGNIDPVACTFTKLRVGAAVSMYARMLTSGKDYALLRGKTQQELFDIITGIQNVSERLRI